MASQFYEQALNLAKKEMNLRKSRHEDPYLPVLDDLVPGVLALPAQQLRLVSIPLNQIVGTATHGRTNAFAANFMPAIEGRSEFVAKWDSLYASVINVGVNSPIKAYEYMNKFYVIEGNKRVSVMKFLDAAAIEGEVTRLIPPRTDDEENRIYYEFLDFYKDTGINNITFSRPGGFAKLYGFMGAEPGKKWPISMIRDFRSAYMRFTSVYHALGGNRLSITPGDAFLIYLRVYGFRQAEERDTDSLREDTLKIWDEIRISAQDEQVVLVMEPTAGGAPPFFMGLLGPRQLKAAFLYSRPPEESGWNYWHEIGRSHVDAALAGQVKTQVKIARGDEETAEALTQLSKEGTDVVFTTSPLFLSESIRMSVAHPEMKILNCSLLASFHRVRSYYLRVYEAKFILGAIAGALTENNRVGYVADYPIYGTPASINAFALGARLVNPRTMVFLDWSTRRDHDVYETFRGNDVNIICNRDISAPAQGSREFGLYRVGRDGAPDNLAMPVLNWGSLYETILRSLSNGSWKDADDRDLATAYWPGISTGAVEVFSSRRLPPGTQQLADMLIRLFQTGAFNPFSSRIVSQDGMVHAQSDEPLSPAEIVTMDFLVDNVIGTLPDIDQLRQDARPLVRLQGLNAENPLDPTQLTWQENDKKS